MQFQINFPIAQQKTQITYPDKIFLIGSCFTENISKKLEDVKLETFINPHGILFNPVSVCSSLRDVMRKQIYTKDNLFYLNEMWHSWLHHSKFSGVTPEEALQKMNNSITQAHQFLLESKWLIITLGSAFAYRHNDLDMHVSNNHRAPQTWFTKELLEINFIKEQLKNTIKDLQDFNPSLKIIFTISPVRHLRDGVIENNKSKARLLDAVHNVINENENCFYFPSYEIVIDELRDYRFYDIDFAHPNYLATEYVWSRFVDVAINKNCYPIMEDLLDIKLAFNHKTFNVKSNAHQQFLNQYLNKCIALQNEFSFLNLQNEIDYFKNCN